MAVHGNSGLLKGSIKCALSPEPIRVENPPSTRRKPRIKIMDLKITHINKTVENIMQKGATKNNKKNAFRMLKNPL